MTAHTVAALLVAALSGSINVDPLVQEIQEHQYQQVAVCPRPIVVNGQGQTTVDDIALLAQEQIEQITQQLTARAGGSYTVLASDLVFDSIKGLTIDSLANPDVRRGIGERTGAEAMLFVFVEQNTDDGNWDVLYKLVQLADSTVAIEETETLDLIISDAAYMGESFEVRRWGVTGLEAVGFKPRPAWTGRWASSRNTSAISTLN